MTTLPPKIRILFIQPDLTDQIDLATGKELRNLVEGLVREVNREGWEWHVLPSAKIKDLAWGLDY